MSLARERIEFYTSPFFPTPKVSKLFFYQLEDFRAWIVGSVALAALSFSCNLPGCNLPGCNLPVPDNLNVITSALTEEAWITCMLDHGYKLRLVPCGNFYAKLAQSRLIFSHEDIEVSNLPSNSVTLLNEPGL
jgi:hypothetical protein